MMQRTQIKSSFVTIDKEIRFGKPCFEGTRIPIIDIFEYIYCGWDIDKICNNFPAIEKKSLISFLKEVGENFERRYGE